VALLRDFDEARLFGVRLYAQRLRQALAGRCELVDIHPWPRDAAGPQALRPLQTLLVKEVVYPWLARRVRADVAHVVDQSHASLVRSLDGQATVVTCHDLWGLRYGSPLRRYAYRRRVLSLRRATRVVAVSETVREDVVGLGVEARRVAVVRNRVEAFFVERPAAAELDRAVGRFRVQPRAFFLHVGNNLPYKNVEGLLRALGEFGRQRGRAPDLVKVGAQPTPAQQRLAASENVALRWLGEVSISELRALYHLATSLVYPSLDEGFGWPVAEALACGLPVIASRLGALAEIAGDAALLVDPTATSELVAALTRVESDAALRDELSARGRARGEWLAGGDFGSELLDVYAAANSEKAAR
jgi:glycosyltransferase involved in cell wall biosynthesis